MQLVWGPHFENHGPGRPIPAVTLASSAAATSSSATPCCSLDVTAGPASEPFIFCPLGERHSPPSDTCVACSSTVWSPASLTAPRAPTSGHTHRVVPPTFVQGGAVPGRTCRPQGASLLTLDYKRWHGSARSLRQSALCGSPWPECGPAGTPATTRRERLQPQSSPWRHGGWCVDRSLRGHPSPNRPAQPLLTP